MTIQQPYLRVKGDIFVGEDPDVEPGEKENGETKLFELTRDSFECERSAKSHRRPYGRNEERLKDNTYLYENILSGGLTALPDPPPNGFRYRE